MVIMVGGLGPAIPLERCPKPMLPVAGRPMLEHIIERARLEGFNHFVLAIHYLGHMIEDYFGDGAPGCAHRLSGKSRLWATAGALSLLNPRPDLPSWSLMAM